MGVWVASLSPFTWNLPPRIHCLFHLVRHQPSHQLSHPLTTSFQHHHAPCIIAPIFRSINEKFHPSFHQDNHRHQAIHQFPPSDQSALSLVSLWLISSWGRSKCYSLRFASHEVHEVSRVGNKRLGGSMGNENPFQAWIFEKGVVKCDTSRCISRCTFNIAVIE